MRSAPGSAPPGGWHPRALQWQVFATVRSKDEVLPLLPHRSHRTGVQGVAKRCEINDVEVKARRPMPGRNLFSSPPVGGIEGRAAAMRSRSCARGTALDPDGLFDFNGTEHRQHPRYPGRHRRPLLPLQDDPPEWLALPMSVTSILVAVNAVSLKAAERYPG